MPVLPFSEYRPDVSDYNGQTSRNILNVIPRGDGYGPQPSLVPFTMALPATCRGAFLARNPDASLSIFAGTATDLYKLDNTLGTWTSVSRIGSYTPLAVNANWQFAQFNNYLFATQQNDLLQIYDLTASTIFSNRLDSNCPQAAYITVVNSFLVLCGILANNVYRIQWSGLNDVSSNQAFTSGINSSDYQDLADGGLVRGVSGGEYGVIFQDQSIRRLLYAPGTAYIFQVERIATEDGLYMPYSLIRSGNNVFWLSAQGFKVLPPGGVPTPIGKERVDRTFFADADFANPQLIIGSADPADNHVRWAYKSVGNSALYCDKQLCYDWALDKFTLISGGNYTGAQYIVSLAQPGMTLEGMDAYYGTNIDTIDATLSSLDAITETSITRIGGVNPNGQFGFFSGPNLQATLETPEQSSDAIGYGTYPALPGYGGTRLYVRGFRAVTDSTSVFGSVSYRENPAGMYNYTSESQSDVRGFVPLRQSARYSRARVRIPAGAVWTFAAGVEPNVAAEGLR